MDRGVFRTKAGLVWFYTLTRVSILIFFAWPAGVMLFASLVPGSLLDEVGGGGVLARGPCIVIVVAFDLL